MKINAQNALSMREKDEQLYIYCCLWSGYPHNKYTPQEWFIVCNFPSAFWKKKKT